VYTLLIIHHYITLHSKKGGSAPNYQSRATGL
jgi:hypothetical protein